MKSNGLLKKLTSFFVAVVTLVMCFPMLGMNVTAADDSKITVFPAIQSYYFAPIGSRDDLLYFANDSDYSGPKIGSYVSMESLNAYNNGWDRKQFGALLMCKPNDSERFLAGKATTGYSIQTREKSTSIFKYVSTSTKLADRKGFYALSLEDIPIIEWVQTHNTYDDGTSRPGTVMKYSKSNYGSYASFSARKNDDVNRQPVYCIRCRENGSPTNDFYYEYDDYRLGPREGSSQRTWWYIFFKQSYTDGRCIIVHDVKGSCFSKSIATNCVTISDGNTPNDNIPFCLWIAYVDNGYISGIGAGAYQIEKGNTVRTTTPLTLVKKGATLNVYGDLIIDKEFRLAGTLNVYGNVIVSDGGSLYTNYLDDTGSINIYDDGMLYVHSDSVMEIDKLNSGDTNGYVNICGGTFQIGKTLKTNYLNDGETKTASFIKFTDSTNKKPGLFFVGYGTDFYRPNKNCSGTLSDYVSKGSNTVNNDMKINKTYTKNTR